MLTSLQGQFAIWSYARRNTVHFLAQLSDTDLLKKLPRKTFATIFEQIAEMAWVQKCFVEGIGSGEMDSTNWNVPAFKAKDELFTLLNDTDEKMKNLLEKCSGNEEVAWNSNSRNVHEVVSLMIMHETMHLGQIIAFCNALGIVVPEDIVKGLFLTS